MGIKRQIRRVHEKIIHQANVVFGSESRKYHLKRDFLDSLVSEGEDREKIMEGATRALSRLREIYRSCGAEAVREIIGV